MTTWQPCYLSEIAEMVYADRTFIKNTFVSMSTCKLYFLSPYLFLVNYEHEWKQWIAAKPKGPLATVCSYSRPNAVRTSNFLIVRLSIITNLFTSKTLSREFFIKPIEFCHSILRNTQLCSAFLIAYRCQTISGPTGDKMWLV